MPHSNQKLTRAQVNKANEFYTRLADIEEEVRHYKAHFNNKVIYCNCDDPRFSKFFYYFADKFEEFKIKKLISSCYKDAQGNLFDRRDHERAFYVEYLGDKKDGRVPDIEDIGVKYFDRDGDFRSRECIELLKQADIVVTNPPFSLIRAYIAQVMKYKKKFLIVANPNCLHCKTIFPLIHSGAIWLGHSEGRGMRFEVSEEYGAQLVKNKQEGTSYIIEDGKVMAIVLSQWITNLTHNKRNAKMKLSKTYNPADYPTYDNYHAINVDKINDIPKDYTGVMGVPSTFLHKYNPDQFEILGIDFQISKNLLPELRNREWRGKLRSGCVNGKFKFSRILIRNKEPQNARE